MYCDISKDLNFQPACIKEVRNPSPGEMYQVELQYLIISDYAIFGHETGISCVITKFGIITSAVVMWETPSNKWRI